MYNIKINLLLFSIISIFTLSVTALANTCEQNLNNMRGNSQSRGLCGYVPNLCLNIAANTFNDCLGTNPDPLRAGICCFERQEDLYLCLNPSLPTDQSSCEELEESVINNCSIFCSNNFVVPIEQTSCQLSAIFAMEESNWTNNCNDNNCRGQNCNNIFPTVE